MSNISQPTKLEYIREGSAGKDTSPSVKMPSVSSVNELGTMDGVGKKFGRIFRNCVKTISPRI
jgi:hypothetical protein